MRRRVQADPASIAFAALAEEFRRTGRNDEAIETCRQGLQRHPAYLSARVTLGRALIEAGDYDGARAELELVLQSAPENLAAIRGLAQIHERLGHSTEMHPDLHAVVQEGEARRHEEIRREEEQARLREEQARVREEQARVREEQARRQEEEARQAEQVRRQEEQARRQEEEMRRREHQARQEEEQRAAAAAAAAVAAAEPESVSSSLADGLNLDSLELSLDIPGLPPVSASTDEPFDIFEAALERTPVPALAPLTDPLFIPDPEPEFSEPVVISGAAAAEPIVAPDAHVAAAVIRLERFLGAIQAARRA